MSDFDIAEMLHDANKFADDNNYVEAAEIYLKITNIDNNCTSAWYGLGVSNAKLGDINKSIRSFEQAHRINPDYGCLLYTSPSPRDLSTSRMPSSA